MSDDVTVKVMLNLHREICERCQQLAPYFAKNSLRGTSSRADVMRKALSIGLDVLEKGQVKEEMGEEKA